MSIQEDHGALLHDANGILQAHKEALERPHDMSAQEQFRRVAIVNSVPVARAAIAIVQWAKVKAMSDRMAEDTGLWFVAAFASEAYLQQELRKLCAAIDAAAKE